jgi:membrane-associated phospholipid phosphatase
VIEIFKARYFLFGFTAATYLAAWILTYLVSLKVDSTKFLASAASSLICVASFSYLFRDPKLQHLRSVVETLGLGIALTGPLIMLTYLAALTNHPLQDRHLMQIDQNLGIDWTTLTAAVDAHPIFARALTLAYNSFAFQLLLLPALLSISRQAARAYQMVAVYGFICIFASFISIWYPALGTYAALSIDISQFKNIDASWGVASVNQIMAVRNNPGFILRLDQASGIITFPSVHAAVAILCAWAIWPLKLARFPFIVLNIFMFFSAIVVGGHYVVDLISGTGITGFAIALVLYVTRLPPRKSASLCENAQLSH